MNPVCTCPRCSTPRLDGACPRCLLDDASTPSELGIRPLWEDLGEAGEFFEVIGDFAVLTLVGEGGMGRVFHARQLSTGREVAIKLLRDAVPAARFRHEISVLARLAHPGLVPIFQAGEHRERPYFAMEFIAGPNLAQRAQAQPFSPREAAALVAAAARAVHHAHERGILHRDLKPQNILLAPGGTSRVTDFGLARSLAPDAASLTMTGAQLGTPAYMAPEQVAGDRDREGPATDVYGIGATLYHLLTGVPPFRADSVERIFQLVLDTEPPAPRLLNPTLDRDLETLVLACLEKDPSRRYASAAELADELDRWLVGEPIRRRPVGPVGNVVKWCRRRPAVAGLIASTSLGLGLTVAVLFVSGHRLRDSLARMTIAERSARDWAAVNRAQLYAADIALAEQAILAGNLGRGRELLASHLPGNGQKDPRGFEWHYLSALAQGDPAEIEAHDAEISAVALSSDGRWQAAGDLAGKLQLKSLDAAGSHRVLILTNRSVTDLDFSPDHLQLAVSSRTARTGDGRIFLFDLASLDRPTVLTQEVSHLRFLAGTNLLAVCASHRFYADRNAPLDVLRLPSGELVRSVTNACSRFAISRDGTRAATFTHPASVTLWKLPEWQRLQTWTTSREKLMSLAFSPSGDRLTAGDFEGALLLWQRALDWRETSFQALSDGACNRAAFLSDAEPIVATCGSQTVKLWQLEASTGRWLPLRTFRGHEREVSTLAVHPATQRILSGSRDRTARLWSADRPTRVQLTVPTALTPAGWSVRFSSTGNVAVVRDSEDTLSLRDSQTWTVLTNIAAPHYPLTISDGGAEVGLLDFERRMLTIWERAERRVVRSIPLADLEDGTNYVWFQASSDARLLAGSRKDATVQVWSLRDGTLQHHLRGHEGGYVYACAFAPDGGHLATPGSDGTVRLWDMADGREKQVFRDSARLFCAAFSPDGRVLATAGNSGRVSLWDVASGQRLAQLPDHGTDFWVSFSTDNRTIATQSPGFVHLWSTANWRPLMHFPAPGVDAAALQFGPDSRSLWMQPLNQPLVTGWRAP